MEARPAFTEDPQKYLLKIYFPDSYQNDNYIAYYNFYEQHKDLFAIARGKEPNCILFVAFFLQNRIRFHC